MCVGVGEEPEERLEHGWPQLPEHHRGRVSGARLTLLAQHEDQRRHHLRARFDLRQLVSGQPANAPALVSQRRHELRQRRRIDGELFELLEAEVGHEGEYRAVSAKRETEKISAPDARLGSI